MSQITMSMSELADAMMIAEAQGRTIPGLRSKTKEFFLAIARGEVARELLDRYEQHWDTHLLPTLAKLPLDEQRRIASGERIPVAINEEEVVSMAPEQMTRDQRERVFGSGRIATPDEQRQGRKYSPVTGWSSPEQR